MSYVTLAEAKEFLDVIHSADDAKLQTLLDGAEREALDFMNRDYFGGDCPSCESSESDSEGTMPASVRTGVLFALQGAYQATPEQRIKLREAAEVLWMPYRCGLGV